MCKKGFWSGMIAGAAVGAAVGIFADPINDKTHNKLKSTTGNMFKTIGTVIDSVMENM